MAASTPRLAGQGSGRLVTAADPGDAIRPVAGHLGAPAVERPRPLAPVEGGERPLQLVGVGPVDPLGRVIGQRHLEGHRATVRQAACGHPEPKPCELTQLSTTSGLTGTDPLRSAISVQTVRVVVVVAELDFELELQPVTVTRAIAVTAMMNDLSLIVRILSGWSRAESSEPSGRIRYLACTARGLCRCLHEYSDACMLMP